MAVPLSQREIEILRLVATGATNQQIAAQLDITLNTVKVHLRNIFAKIGVTSRTEASLYAVRMGLVVIEPSYVPAAHVEPPPVEAVAVETLPARSPEVVVVETLPARPPEAVVVESTPALVPSPAPTASVWRFPLPWIIGLVLIGLLLVAMTVWLVSSLTAATPGAPATATASTPPNHWLRLATMNVPRVNFGLVGDDGRVYAVGGTGPEGVSGVLERYNPQSNTWTTLTAHPTPVTDIQAVAIGGKIYVAGGQLASGEISDQFMVYDPDLDQWRALAPLPEPRSQYAAATLDGKFYLFGGWDGSQYRDSVWRFDPDLGQWQVRTPMPNARGQMGANVVNNRIHLLGGRDANGPLALHQSYDPTQDRENAQPWRVLPRLPQALAHPATATVITSIFVFDPTTSELLIYDTSSESWAQAPTELPPNSNYLSAVLVNTRIYLLGQATIASASSFHLAFEAIYQAQLPLISR